MMKGDSSHTGWKEQYSKARAETTCEIQGHKWSCAMETPRRPGKKRLEEAMKKSSDDGKDSEMPLHKGPRKPSLVYMDRCVCMSVSVCVFKHSVKSHSLQACRKFLGTDMSATVP